MNIRTKQQFSIFLVTLVCLSCGNRTKNASKGIKNTAKEYKIMGTWESSCTSSKILGASMKEFYEFSGSELTRSTELYAAANCKEESISIQHQGRFALGDRNDFGEKSRSIDLDYQTTSITPLTEGGVKLLDVAHFCGISNWRVNSKTAIPESQKALTCPIEHTPKKVYDIVKIEEEKLFFGSGKSKDSPKNRPLELNRDDFYLVTP